MAGYIHPKALGGSTTSAAGVSAIGLAEPTKYSSLADFMGDINALDVRPDLIKAFGNQGITGFLRLTGAVKAAGSAEYVTYYEEARLHAPLRASIKTGSVTTDGGSETITLDGIENAANATSDYPNVAMEGDILLFNNVDRAVVTGATATELTVVPLNAWSVAHAGDSATYYTFIIVGNMFGEGKDQPDRYLESNVVRRQNPYAIVKGNYEVSGSQATNIGYIDVGGGDYRWYIKGEMDARQRFMDKREMTLLFGEEAGNANVGFNGTEGYISALEDRGLNSSLIGNAAGFTDIDALIREFDKQGAPPEYAMYVNTGQSLLIDDMVAAGGASSKAGIAGVTSSYGAFQNSADMAVQLGFNSFSRGGYTFHKHSWKLLNDPTLLGGGFTGNADISGELVAGVMVPLSTVVDPTSGERAPSLELNYKAAGGYSREMEHWVTGSILGFNNDTKDVAKFNYRSECALVTRAANQHVLIKG